MSLLVLALLPVHVHMLPLSQVLRTHLCRWEFFLKSWMAVSDHKKDSFTLKISSSYQAPARVFSTKLLMPVQLNGSKVYLLNACGLQGSLAKASSPAVPSCLTASISCTAVAASNGYRYWFYLWGWNANRLECGWAQLCLNMLTNHKVCNYSTARCNLQERCLYYADVAPIYTTYPI